MTAPKATAVTIARGIILVGRTDSSPSEPADSKPANARKPDVAASARVETPTPCGSTMTRPDRVWPPGAAPAARRQKITAMSTRMRQTDTTSKARTDRVVGRTPAGRQNPDNRPGGERERVPAGVAGQSRGVGEGAPEDGDPHDGYGREHQVGAEQRPSG